MITLLTPETAWISILEKIPEWQPPLSRTVLISPHPDDETLGVGGLIFDLSHLGVDIMIVTVTDGENAYANTPGLGDIRVNEQVLALEKLGVSAENIKRLQFVDSAVAQSENKLEQALRPLIDKQMHVLAPWPGDFHPDHIAVGRVAEKIAKDCGAMLTYYFFWTWHQGTPEQIRELPLRRYSLSSEALTAKWEALSCHESQLKHVSNEPILPNEFLEPARRSFEVYLPL